MALLLVNLWRALNVINIPGGCAIETKFSLMRKCDPFLFRVSANDGITSRSPRTREATDLYESVIRWQFTTCEL